MLSGYVGIRERRKEREETRAENERAHQEQEAGAERRHQAMMAMIMVTIAHGQEMMAAALANSNWGGDDAIRSLQQ